MRLRNISFSLITSCLVGLTSISVLLGWIFHSAAVIQFNTSFAPMQFNTAIALLVWSIVLQLMQTRARPVSLLMSLGVLAMLIITLLEYALDRNLGIDTLLIEPFFRANTLSLGRMAPNTASALTAIGLALLLLHGNKDRHISQVRLSFIIIFSVVAFSLGLIPLVGYSNNLESAYAWGHFTRMAVHTAACVSLIGLCLFVIIWKNIVNRLIVAPISILLCGVFLTGLISIAIHSQENLYFENNLQLKANSIASIATVQWQDLYKSLERMRDRWGYVPEISEALLKHDVENYIKDFPYIVMLGWANKEGQVQWLLPDKGRSSYLQENVLLDASIAKALKIDLSRNGLQEQFISLEKNPTHYLYLNPVSDSAISKGYLIVQISTPQFFSHLLLFLQIEKSYYVSIYDKDVLLFSNISTPALQDHPEIFEWQKNAIFTNHHMAWRVAVNPTQEMLAEKNTVTPWVVLLAGLFTSLIAAVAVFFTLKWQQSAKLLSAAQKLNDAVMDSAAYLIIATDSTGKIVLFNKFAEEALQYTRDEALNDITPAIWHDEEEVKKRSQELSVELGRDIQPGFDVFTAKALLNQNEVREWTFIRKDKTTFTGSLIVSPLKSETGEIMGFLGIIQDLTERKRAEQQVAKYTKDLERSNQDILLLNELSNNLQACTTIDETFEPIRLYCQQALKVLKGTLYIIDKSKTQLTDVIDWGYEKAHKMYLNVEDCRALRLKKIYQVVHPEVDLICQHMKSESEILPYLCLPIQSHFEILGLLHLEMPKESTNFLTLSTSGLIQLMAEQLALSFVSLELRDNLRMQSMHDPLTGLYNRRYLEHTIKQEILNADRDEISLGIMMIDIDFFKQINDNYGHPTGDQVLKRLSQLFLEHIKDMDIACRWGGEEFLLFYKDISIDALYEKAEKLRRDVLQLQIQHDAIRINHLAISIGLAIYPADGRTLDVLVAAADRALYKAKNTGRNKVVIASI